MSSANLFTQAMRQVQAGAVQVNVAAPMLATAAIYDSVRVPSTVGVLDPTDTANAPDRLSDAKRGLAIILTAIAYKTPEPLANAGTSIIRLRAWTNFIITAYTQVFRYNSLDQSLAQGSHELDPAAVNELRLLVRNMHIVAVNFVNGQPEGTGPASPMGLNSAIRVFILNQGLPSINPLTYEEFSLLSRCGTVLQRSAFLALNVFLAGRPYSGSAASASTARPRNIEVACNNGVVWPEISGRVQRSIGAIIEIGRAWEQEGVVRAALIRPLISLYGNVASAELRPISIIVGLLPYAQMSHVIIVHDFIRAYPHISQIKSLELEMAYMVSCAEAWLAYPASERPFTKLILRDSAKFFDSKSMDRLIRLAVDIMSRQAQSLAGYAISGADPQLMQEFDALTTAVGAAIVLSPGTQPVINPGTTMQVPVIPPTAPLAAPTT